MNRYSDMTIWQLQEELAAIKSELATRSVEEEDEYHICGGEVRVWMRSQCGLCGDGPIRNPRKREPNAAAQAPLPARLGSDVKVDSRQVESATDASAYPAPAAPDVAGMVKRLEGLPWPKLSYPDEAEMRDLGYAALPLLQELPALLARLGEGAPLSADYIQTVPDKCDRIIWRGRYYHLPLAPGASDE